MAVKRAGLLALCVLVAAPVALVTERIAWPGGRVAQVLGRLFCSAVLRLLRIRIEVTGPLPPRRSGRLLVANHVSWIDPLVLFAVSPAVILAKREVGTWPVIAALTRLQGTVLVDRARRMQIPKVNDALAQRLQVGGNVLLFPEGTTHDGVRRGRFLTSHLACLAKVVAPVRPSVQVAALAYSSPKAAWIGDDTLLPHLWSVLRRPGMTCRVAFGTPMEVPQPFDRKALGRTLAAEVEMVLQSPAHQARVATPAANKRASGLIVTEA